MIITINRVGMVMAMTIAVGSVVATNVKVKALSQEIQVLNESAVPITNTIYDRSVIQNFRNSIERLDKHLQKKKTPLDQSKESGYG
ncbi:MAG TPA: hypothetical protein QF708_05070 [Candidatus Poseidoniia archaeon]|jgi:hypothetical protein|nr:hypothetical protein [Candidatus Poseidoniia archaeon]|tara:strand:- start:818 stop:1075 length:258 start_codon:yes stop_codon:yes gene_type:complete